MTDPLKIVLVGAGHMGRLHARALAERADARLVAVCDTDLVAARAVAEPFGARASADVRDAARGADAAILAAATAAHHDLALALLDAGVALLVEKPLAASAAGARDIAQAARRAGAVVQVGHILRFDPVTRALAGPGAPGFAPRRIEAVWRSPFTGRSTDVSVVSDMMIHALDLVLAWTGEMPRAVRASGRIVKGPHLDEVEAHLDFPGGCSAHLVASRVSEARERRISIETDGGIIVLDYAARSAERDGKALPVAAAPDALRAQLAAFLDAVRGERPVAVSADEGARAVEVAEQIERAAAV